MSGPDPMDSFNALVTFWHIIVKGLPPLFSGYSVVLLVALFFSWKFGLSVGYRRREADERKEAEKFSNAMGRFMCDYVNKTMVPMIDHNSKYELDTVGEAATKTAS